MPPVSGSLPSRSEADSKKGCIALLLILISLFFQAARVALAHLTLKGQFPCSEPTVFLHLVDSKDQEDKTVS